MVDEIRGVAHTTVQDGPRRSEHPLGRVPGGLLQLIVPGLLVFLTDLAGEDDAVSPASHIRQDDGTECWPVEHGDGFYTVKGNLLVYISYTNMYYGGLKLYLLNYIKNYYIIGGCLPSTVMQFGGSKNGCMEIDFVNKHFFISFHNS